jgi:hypothetical protein
MKKPKSKKALRGRAEVRLQMKVVERVIKRYRNALRKLAG